jgi:hypothetical protein
VWLGLWIEGFEAKERKREGKRGWREVVGKDVGNSFKEGDLFF